MALFNYATRELSAKIVYYGPGLSGKTTNIEMVHKMLRPEQKGRLISLPTETDRTLFFDFLPIEHMEQQDFMAGVLQPAERFVERVLRREQIGDDEHHAAALHPFGGFHENRPQIGLPRHFDRFQHIDNFRKLRAHGARAQFGGAPGRCGGQSDRVALADEQRRQ